MNPRVAVIGLGWMGTEHARVLARRSDIDLVAVIDNNQARAFELAEQLGCAAFTSWREVLTRVDAVSVCTPDSAHEEIVVAALNAGLSVMVEKPMATSSEAAERMLNAADGDASRLTVGHLLQHDPRIVRARDLVAAGHIGKLWHARVRRHASRTVARHVAGRSSVGWFGTIHDAELLLSFMPSAPVFVRASGRRELVSKEWDLIDAVVEFEGGEYGTLHESWTLGAARPNRSDSGLALIGETGSIDIDLGHGQVMLSDEDGASAPDVMHYPSASLLDASDLQTEIESWILTLSTGRQHGVDGERAFASVRLVEAVHDSLRREGDVVSLRPGSSERNCHE